jgi:hypothetical protein
MKGMFLLVFGIVLALTSIIGLIQNSILLFAFIGTGSAPSAGWYASVAISIVFVVVAIFSLRAKNSPPAKHWSLSLIGGVLGFLGAGLLKGVLFALVGSL